MIDLSFQLNLIRNRIAQISVGFIIVFDPLTLHCYSFDNNQDSSFHHTLCETKKFRTVKN